MAKQTEQSKKEKFHLILAVWGETYINLFLNVSLPSLMAEGNLPVLYSDEKQDFYIYTRSEDIKQFEEHIAFAKVKDFFTIVYVNIDIEFPAGHSWSVMTSCHNHAVRQAFQKRSTMILLIPDHIYADGSFRTLLRLYREGYHAVLVLQLAVKRDVFLEECLKLYNRETHTLAIDARRLLALWQKYRHPNSDFYSCDLTHFPNYSPCLLRWQIDNNTFVVRSTQFTPFLIHPENEFQLRNNDVYVETLDTVLVKNVVADPRRVYIITDSDEGVQLDMRPATEEYSVAYDRPNLPMIAFCLNQFRINGNGDAAYLDQKLCFHIHEISKDTGAMQKADQMFETIKDLSTFHSCEEFLEKLKQYFTKLVGTRTVRVVGRGYIADLSADFFKTMGFAVEQSENLSGISDSHYAVLTNKDTFEQASFHLTVLYMNHERDFMLSPLTFRLFRMNVFKGNSWKRFYYDYYCQYYLSVKNNGVLWAWRRIKQKFL